MSQKSNYDEHVGRQRPFQDTRLWRAYKLILSVVESSSFPEVAPRSIDSNSANLHRSDIEKGDDHH